MIKANLKSQKSESENINIKSKTFLTSFVYTEQTTNTTQTNQTKIFIVYYESKISKKPLGFIPHPSFQVTLTTNPPLQNKSDTESDYGSDGSVYNVGKYSSRFVFGFVFATIVLAGEVVQ